MPHRPQAVSHRDSQKQLLLDLLRPFQLHQTTAHRYLGPHGYRLLSIRPRERSVVHRSAGRVHEGRIGEWYQKDVIQFAANRVAFQAEAVSPRTSLGHEPHAKILQLRIAQQRKVRCRRNRARSLHPRRALAPIPPIRVTTDEGTVRGHPANAAALQTLQIRRLRNPTVQTPNRRHDDHLHPSVAALFHQPLRLLPAR